VTSEAGRSVAGSDAPAEPLARLYVDVPLPHLDRLFDYAVPDSLAGEVQAGSRVRIRFAGRLVDGYVIERASTSEHTGRLAAIDRVVGEPVLTPATAELFRAVADRWGGNFVDVVRLGVPARHARAERAATIPMPAPPGAPDPAGWARYPAGAAYLKAVQGGRPARAVWAALPGEDWTSRLVDAMQATLAGGRGALAVVPDARDLARIDAALSERLGAGQHVALSADLGPSERYRRWLAVRRGTVRAVVGTRGVALAPVADLGLAVVWDDGDDLHDEPRAPYPTVRDLLALRSAHERCALLVAGYSRSTEAELLVRSGWARAITAERSVVRAAAPRIVAGGGDSEQRRDAAAAAARLPSLALRTARSVLESQRPILVQVPRAGYAPALACANDRTPARCRHCSGPLTLVAASGPPSCRWCGRPAADWACPVCGQHRLRAQVTGSGRTAEELGRAFPGATIRTSGAPAVLDQVPAGPSVVVATPGAEPLVDGGYGAALLLDGWALLGRADLRATEETLRRWLNASALVAADGEVIVVGADAAVPTVQALIRWDPVGHAARELAEREALGLTPATRMASVRGTAAAIEDFFAGARLPDTAERIGPVEIAPGLDGASFDDESRGRQQVLVRVPRRDGAELAQALHAAAGLRSARKASEPVRIELDPRILG
jgi:primosomal protein N' (replication factor Y)